MNEATINTIQHAPLKISARFIRHFFYELKSECDSYGTSTWARLYLSSGDARTSTAKEKLTCLRYYYRRSVIATCQEDRSASEQEARKGGARPERT